MKQDAKPHVPAKETKAWAERLWRMVLGDDDPRVTRPRFRYELIGNVEHVHRARPKPVIVVSPLLRAHPIHSSRYTGAKLRALRKQRLAPHRLGSV